MKDSEILLNILKIIVSLKFLFNKRV